MRSHEIRTSFRDYFAARDHVVVPSASLVPPSLDPTVLLTTAGMQPFKSYFLGLETPPGPRVTSIQKCFRTTDIEVVGQTARHLTFFEMMGNFSFGDYFKERAIAQAWELSLEGWKMDPERLWVTVYEGGDGVPRDDEAIDLWRAIGQPDERIVALGEDNFWKAGPTGPCGPCSELFYDRGPEHGCGRPLGGGPDQCGPQCDCDRVLEYWNLVFMQFDRQESGLTPLPKPSIDTGAGVERISALLQGVHSVYETDGFQEVIAACESWSGAKYTDGGTAMRALRVLADHGRGMAFLATDGVIPSNEQRGYILRRIIRRAVSHGHRIGLPSPFLTKLHGVIVDQFGEAYPDLVQHRDEVAEILSGEEERFTRTLETGTAILEDVIARTKAAGAIEIPASDAFQLHDTYGFPIEVTAEIAAEHGLAIDEAGFAAQMDAQRRRAREAAKGGKEREVAAAFAREAGFRTEFTGYDDLDVVTTAEAVQELGDGRLLVKLRRSPFYPEGGGQVSDTGVLEGPAGRAAVVEAYRFDGDQALAVLLEHGSIAAGETVRAEVDRSHRRPTAANHTGTHLLHRALREVLGDHAHQRGSAVRPDKLRFDFSHTGPMTPEQLAEVEDRVNDAVVYNYPLHIFETSQDEARKLGATMLFGEKYGDVVRVVDIDRVLDRALRRHARAVDGRGGAVQDPLGVVGGAGRAAHRGRHQRRRAGAPARPRARVGRPGTRFEDRAGARRGGGRQASQARARAGEVEGRGAPPAAASTSRRSSARPPGTMASPSWRCRRATRRPTTCSSSPIACAARSARRWSCSPPPPAAARTWSHPPPPRPSRRVATPPP